MNACPNWRELLAPRFERPRSVTADAAGADNLALALAHFDGCPACRREACRIDPTLIFRRLPAAALDFDLEAERMRLAVAGMRASERVETRHASAMASPLGRSLRGRFRSQGARWALAAGLAAASLVLGGRGDLAGSRSEPSGHAASLAVSGEVVPASFDRLEAPAAVESAVEDLGRPDARIYQLDGERLSVVMIVDEKLDV